MALMSPSIYSTAMPQETDQSLIERLHNMLQRARITDDQIMNGVRLTPTGFQKAGAALGISGEEAELLLNSLITKLRREKDRTDEMFREFAGDRPRAARFSVEKDYLGNVTVRDAQTGKEVFLRGDDATALLNKIKTGDEQAILAQYQGLMEGEEDHWAARRETGFFGRQGAGCIILARSTNRILIAQRGHGCEEAGTWGSWGGAIDDGESPVEAVRREVAEETGADVEIEEIVPLYVFQKGTFRYSNFLVIVPEEFHPRIINWETANYEWCEFGHWPHPLHFGLQALFADKPSMKKIESVIAANPHPVRESMELDEDDGFDAELRSSAGSFNFPWKHGAEHGFATARFQGRGPGMKITVVSVRDAEGDPVDTSAFHDTVHQQAVDFIGEE